MDLLVFETNYVVLYYDSQLGCDFLCFVNTKEEKKARMNGI